MPTTPRHRLVGILVLLGCLFGLVIWFGPLAPAPEVGEYPDQEQLGTNYDPWIGDRASLTGTVVDTDPLTITAGDGTGEQVRLRITDTTTHAHERDSLAVYGVVEPDNTIRTLNAYTVPPTNYLYMYTVSFLAGLWVLGRIIQTWRIDWETWSLEPRTTPLRVCDLAIQNQTEEHDA